MQPSRTHCAQSSGLLAKKGIQQVAHVQPTLASQLRAGFDTNFVGAAVGDGVGVLVGDGVGAAVGDGVGANVFVGAAVGTGVGAAVGAGDGNGVGEGVGVAATLYTTPPILISSPTKMLVLRSTAQPISTSPFTTDTVASRASQAYSAV